MVSQPHATHKPPLCPGRAPLTRSLFPILGAAASSSPLRASSDLEQARPQTSGEEELQLQLALAMSREENEKPPLPMDIDEQTQLQIAMSLSKEEAQKPDPPPPVAAEMDEDTQLQIALSLSKEEHQQEQQSRQGDESLLQKALEASKREAVAGGVGSAMMDLVDVFAVNPEFLPGTSVNPRDLTGPERHTPLHHPIPAAGAGCLAGTRASSDPWDSLVESRSTRPVNDSLWMAQPSSGTSSLPWERTRSPPDPWENAAAADPFSGPAPLRVHPPRHGSPTDGDMFDEAMDGGHFSLSSRGEREVSPELFDMSRLGESLGDPNQRNCRTPESFLGPTGVSLVNLDTLIPVNPPAKTKNPFLSGLSAPSPLNPFQSEQPRLTLNQMRPSSTSPVPPSGPSSLPYSASLPLPAASHQPANLPSSFTQPAHGGLDMPGLPQPLLPFSSTSSLGDQHSQNPFL
ncbi:hypothetical protein DPEC_G00309990 [Dallia pectoralis]|uniref:Uncharacterized protein n=1 Tax=Dallia pectoralis TaxID=75939 RepID=A0ACC2FFC6_DALPE|nr:hypothetical protein DPEC_G00309990 [Dallia pectoralis]